MCFTAIVKLFYPLSRPIAELIDQFNMLALSSKDLSIPQLVELIDLFFYGFMK